MSLACLAASESEADSWYAPSAWEERGHRYSKRDAQAEAFYGPYGYSNWGQNWPMIHNNNPMMYNNNPVMYNNNNWVPGNWMNMNSWNWNMNSMPSMQVVF